MKKQISWPWFFIRLLPVFILIVFMIGNMGNTAGIDSNKINGILNTVASDIEPMSLSNVIGEIWDTIAGNSEGDFINKPITYFVISYICYLVLIEITKIFYEVITFLPKFCTSVFERKTKEKK